MMGPIRRKVLKFAAGGALASNLPQGLARDAASRYGPGASDTEILIGNIVPYSGPASAYGVVGKALGAYFDLINAEGGIGGRRLRLISLDDAYTSSRTLEQARRLVERDRVLFITQVLGTAPNLAIRKYLNQRQVPHLFAASGATLWGDHGEYPWTMGWQPSYQSEARIYARHILETRPAARVAVLLQNDDYGRDYLRGLVDGLGERAASMIVAQATYEVSDPTVESQMLMLRASGADTFFNIATPKAAAQAIRRAAEIGWRPVQYLNSVSSTVAAVLVPAGVDNAVGVISAAYNRDPTDPQWQGTPEFEAWLAWMKRWHPGGDLRDNLNVYAYSVAQTLVQMLRQCGNDLTREHVMRQARNLDMSLPMLLPGIRLKTGAADHFPLEAMQLIRFDGRGWARFGQVYGA
jgi:branched-chain amino acid transport system substrate-binding protein